MVRRPLLILALLGCAQPAVAQFEAPPMSTFESAAAAAQTPGKPAATARSAARSAPGARTPQGTPARTPVQTPAMKPRADRAAAQAEPMIDPNARPASNNAGKADIMKAYQLTQTANDEAAYTEIIDICKRGLQKGVDNKLARYGRKLCAWAHNRRGEALANAGNAEAALEDFESAVALDDQQWRAQHNRGVVFALMGNLPEAIADFTYTIEVNPKFANAWFNRGEMLYEQRDFTGALRDYNQALRLSPNDAAALNSRGHTLYRLQRYAEAMDDYNRALTIDPQSAATLVNRGDLHADQGNYASAARDYRAAIAANPNLGRAYQSAAWLMATCPDEAFRNAPLAIEAAQKAIELDGTADYRYQETLAAAQANAGEFQAAVRTQQQAMQVAPAAVAQVYKGRLEKFRAGRPHREPGVVQASGTRPINNQRPQRK